MTQEQKAKAYDEALNKAKIEINTKGIGETVNLCYQLFPQLAENDDEESDDERIRKRLIEYFEGFRMGNAEVRWEGLIVQEVLSWLEKQKESLPISEICKENANSFTDGIIEVRSFQRGMEEGRRLEKQKEQEPVTIEQVYKEFINPEKLKDAKTNKYIRAQLLWELMHNGIITEVDYQYLTDDKRKPWTAEEYRIAYQKGFDMSEQLKQKEQSEEPKIAFGDWGDKEKKEAIITCLKYMRFIKKITNQEYEDLVRWFEDNLVANVLEKDGWTIASEQTDTIKEDYYGAFLRGEMRGYLRAKNEQKPAPFSCGHENGKQAEWSEEDEAAYNAFICEVVNEKMNPTIEQVKWLRSIRDRLKSLPLSCPKKSDNWKPSEEQMEALNALNLHGDLSYVGQQNQLISLYQDLKKL